MFKDSCLVVISKEGRLIQHELDKRNYTSGIHERVTVPDIEGAVEYKINVPVCAIGILC